MGNIIIIRKSELKRRNNHMARGKRPADFILIFGLIYEVFFR